MTEPIFCPACGEEMTHWHNDIYECSECGGIYECPDDTHITEEWTENEEEEE